MKILEKYKEIKVIQDIAKKDNVKVFLVGGMLRDYILEKENCDFDFAVSRNAIAFAQKFANLIKGAFVLLDEERGCARVAKKLEDGIILTFDFADYRAKTIENDLAHRDFTINTLIVDVNKLNDDVELNKSIQNLKNGLEDIQLSMVRMTNPDVFKEDPLRMLRAYSIKSTLGFRIDKLTEKKIKMDRELIRTVSYERITTELFKILESSNTAKTIRALDKIGLLERIIPQIKIMYNCKQGRYHHLDVWHHSMETVYQMEDVIKEMSDRPEVVEYLDEEIASNRSRKSILKLACLLHDIGKPDTRKKREEGGFSFHGHESVGRDIVKHIANLLKLSTKERHVLEDLVMYHLRPGYLSNHDQPTDKAVYRFFRDTGEEAGNVLLLSMADQRSTCGPLTTPEDHEHHRKICLKYLDEFFAKRNETPFVCLIDGDDLIKELNIKPSPLFKTILDEVAEQQSLEKIKTKEEALTLAKSLAKQG